MVVGVLSDTHLADREMARRLVNELLASFFADVDLVVHAGDIGHPDLLFHFAPLDVIAVGGNTDHPHPQLPASRLVTLDGVKMALAHGWGRAATLERRLLDHFREEDPDLIVFGHSHVPVCRKGDGLLLFNPGSPTQPRSSRGPTVGKLEIEGSSVTGRVVPCPGLLDEGMK